MRVTGIFSHQHTRLPRLDQDVKRLPRTGVWVLIKHELITTLRSGLPGAGYTYVVGRDHLYDRVDLPVPDQGRTGKGIELDDNVWLGAHVVVADGSHVGRDAIIGAGALVIGEIPAYHVAAGMPAKVIRDRRDTGATNA